MRHVARHPQHQRHQGDEPLRRVSTRMITYTFIRHAESTDNRKSLWSGWHDPPLSMHGMRQAQALAAYFSQTHFTAIHVSDLRRTTVTAEFLRAAQPSPTPPLITSSLLREQHFGIAEGQTWTYRQPESTLEEETVQGRYPALRTHSEKFPGGESRNDLVQRVDEAVTKILLPYIWQAAREGKRGTHIAVVSHGLSIYELVEVLVRKGAQERGKTRFPRGLANTGWCQVNVAVKGEKPGERLEKPEDQPLVVEVTHFNNAPHLQKVIRQKDDHAAYDERQTDIRVFFEDGAVKGADQSITPEIE